MKNWSGPEISPCDHGVRTVKTPKIDRTFRSFDPSFFFRRNRRAGIREFALRSKRSRSRSSKDPRASTAKALFTLLTETVRSALEAGASEEAAAGDNAKGGG